MGHHPSPPFYPLGRIPQSPTRPYCQGGTPNFLFGLTDPDDPTKITATKVLHGAQSYAAFKQAIDELVAEAAKGS